MSFTIQNLQGNRVLVSGTDVAGTIGKTIVDGSQWQDLAARKAFTEAEAEFDATVSEFYSVINAATDKLNAAKDAKIVDALDFIVLAEGVERVKGVEAEIVHLTHDSKILRLIEEDANAPRLLWIGDSLEILAA